jgi:hypothetical protein
MPHAKPVRMTQTNALNYGYDERAAGNPKMGTDLFHTGPSPPPSHAEGKAESDRQRMYGASLCTPGVMADDMHRTKLTQQEALCPVQRVRAWQKHIRLSCGGGEPVVDKEDGRIYPRHTHS